MFEAHHRAMHEPRWWELRAALQNWKSGVLSEPEIQRMLRRRRLELDLDLESCHILGQFVPLLVKTFPDAKFILPVRDVRAWLDSLIDDQFFGKHIAAYRNWWKVYDCYFGLRPHGFPAEELPLEDAGLYSLRSYLRYWKLHHERILATVPPERLLIIPTHRIADYGSSLATFAEIEPSSLNLRRSHSYARHQRSGILDKVNEAYLTELIRQEAGDLPELLDGLIQSPVSP